MTVSKDFLTKYFKLLFITFFAIIISLNFYLLNRMISKSSTGQRLEKNIKV